MRRYSILLLLTLVSGLAVAQNRFGYLSYSHVCEQMPQYAQAQKSLDELKAVYDKEARRGEDEFQRKFAEFLEGQKDFPVNILQKRQAELQDLMDKGIAFRRDCQDLLAKAERHLMAAVEDSLNAVIRQVGSQSGYAFIINTDGNTLPFVNGYVGEDVTDLVLIRLGLKEPPIPQPEPAAEPEVDQQDQSAEETPAQPAADAESATQETPATEQPQDAPSTTNIETL